MGTEGSVKVGHKFRDGIRKRWDRLAVAVWRRSRYMRRTHSRETLSDRLAICEMRLHALERQYEHDHPGAWR